MVDRNHERTAVCGNGRGGGNNKKRGKEWGRWCCRGSDGGVDSNVVCCLARWLEVCGGGYRHDQDHRELVLKVVVGGKGNFCGRAIRNSSSVQCMYSFPNHAGTPNATTRCCLSFHVRE
jgi:hypothetical protein